MADQYLQQFAEETAPVATDQIPIADNAMQRVRRMSLATLRANLLDSPTAGSVLFVGAGGVLAQDNANFHWDDANNRLGIGTATPSQKLEVVDSSTPSVDVLALGNNTSTVGANASIAFRTNSNFAGFVLKTTSRIRGICESNSSWGSGALAFETQPSGSSSPVERVRVTSTGLVGINETAPDAMLEVKSNSATEECLHLKAAAGQTAPIARITDSADVDKVVINSLGRLGVGISPAALVDVKSVDTNVVTLNVRGITGQTVDVLRVGDQEGVISVFVDRFGKLYSYNGAAFKVQAGDSVNVWEVFSGSITSLFKPRLASNVPVAFRGLTSQSAHLTEWQDVSGNALMSVSENGYLKIKKTAAPADAELDNNELSIWWDQTNSQVAFKAKNSTGVVKTGTLALA